MTHAVTLSVSTFGIGITVGYFGRLWLRRVRSGLPVRDVESWTEALAGEGASNSVTGGHPEDMNEMPPATDIAAETPIYDGSDLNHGRCPSSRSSFSFSFSTMI